MTDTTPPTMTGIAILLAEFDEPDLPPHLAVPFKDLAMRLRQELPAPRHLQAIRKLVDVRRLTARYAH